MTYQSKFLKNMFQKLQHPKYSFKPNHSKIVDQIQQKVRTLYYCMKIPIKIFQFLPTCHQITNITQMLSNTPDSNHT